MSRKPEEAGELGPVTPSGWLAGAAQVPSPNHDARPPGETARLLVIHAISLPPGEFGGNAVCEFFTNRLDPAVHPYFATIAARRVSAHFFIRRDGQLLQFVSSNARAWHAGTSCWRGQERCNDFSLGIELEGDDYSTFTDAQYEMLNRLIAVLRDRYPLEACVGHADVAPGRKTDPGPCFDWSRISCAAKDA
ncbi:MAG: 1,6-anhydro-N-acetylmuramyl-L-alanine amidase AmpD [Pseudomonadota bacterium]